MKRWPDHRLSLLGWGNAAYALQRLGVAGDAYEATVKAHPDFADAWDNLAQVRSEQGRWVQAQAAIGKAVSLGGPRLAAYQQLAQTIARGGD
ncbi:MAG: tetratricopeptide repeat protein [Hydrogenophaga sp.]